jgi:intracellular septation protein
MRDVFVRLGSDFLSTIIFLGVYLTTGSLALATVLAIAGAAVQVIHARLRGESLNFMAYASLALVIVLGSATLLTNDPRFMLAKPSIAHFAIGAIMLKRGWMLRYMPPIVVETIPEYVTLAGYAWAMLMFALGFGTIAVALTGDLRLWTIYVSVIAIGVKVIAFAVHYVLFRVLVTNRIRAPAGVDLTFATRLAPDTKAMSNAKPH